MFPRYLVTNLVMNLVIHQILQQKLVTYLMTILVNRRAYLFINKMANFVKTILVANLVNHQIG